MLQKLNASSSSQVLQNGQHSKLLLLAEIYSFSIINETCL